MQRPQLVEEEDGDEEEKLYEEEDRIRLIPQPQGP